MRPAPRHRRHLVNTADIEVWPGGVLRARNNRDDRLLSMARHVLRRKRDGRYLAVDTGDGLAAMVHRLDGEPGLADAMHALAHRTHRRAGVEHVGTLPLARLAQRLEQLGLDADAYADRTGLALVPEPDWLQFAGRDRYARPLWLHVDAAAAWARMRAAALHDDVVLEAISGYRSHDYQLGIFERKRARGLTVEDILSVNAAPGFSEHHSGRALDIGAPGEPPAEESFEATAAFAWLTRHAADHGFAMSYPRDNPHGIVYEPWHWRFRTGGDA
jgi:D-alanyl-D-alanine carboxypeptidase